jgi:D-alanine-D-alanine ligase
VFKIEIKKIKNGRVIAMDIHESADPLPGQDDVPGQGYRVGLTYNLKKGIISEVEDIEAEYDSIETVEAIKKALEQAGCTIELIEADGDILSKFLNTKVDIVFNIAEGIYGRGREAQVPALLNFLKIPYTGSDETTLCIALDKALCKRLLSTYRLKTPKYKLFSDTNTKIGNGLKYPLIVKPNAEGSSKGISDLAVVYDQNELKSMLEKNFADYGQAMLVEEYISGREFTVGIVGNGKDAHVFAPMEIIYKRKDKSEVIYSFNVKKNYKEYIEYKCPALIDKDIEAKLINTARKIYNILECRDFSRIDFRVNEQGEVYFIEINPLPGLAPGYSDYPMLVEFNGISYQEIVKMVLNSALQRYGMTPLK